MSYVDIICIKRTVYHQGFNIYFHEKGVDLWEKNAFGHAGKL
jgi:hypothetical protein